MSSLIELTDDVLGALASALPVPSPLRQGGPASAADLAAALPAAPGAAVVTTVGSEPGSPVAGDIGIIVDADLASALKESPLGALEITAAMQPALDAAANAAGTTCVPAQELEVEVALDSLVSKPGVQVFPLLARDGSVTVTAILALTPVAAAPPLPSFPQQGGGTAPVTRPATQAVVPRNGLELLRDVEMEVTVELGRTRMTVRELLSLSPGAVVELDRAAGSPADLLVNKTLIARGEVVVVDEDFGIRITQIVGPNSGEATDAAGGAAA